MQGVEPEQLLQDGGSATGGRVLLSGGEVIEYDWLVVALGAESDPKGVPGVREHAVKFTDLEDAVKIKEKLEAFEARASASVQTPPVVVIVGAGCAGVEVASVIAERMKGGAAVRVVTPGATILEQSPEGQREAAMRVGGRSCWLMHMWCTHADKHTEAHHLLAWMLHVATCKCCRVDAGTIKTLAAMMLAGAVEPWCGGLHKHQGH